MALIDHFITAKCDGHRPMWEIMTRATTPNGAVNADFMHQLCYDTVTYKWYIHTGATVATQTWTELV